MYSCSSIEYWTGSLLGTPVKTLHLDITYSVHVLYGLVSVYLYSLYESLTVIFYSLFFYLFWTLLWVSHHVTQPHSSPHPFISTLCPLDLPCKRKLKKKKRRKLKTINKTKHRKHLSVEAIARHRVSYSLPFCPHIFFLQKFIAVSPWSDLRSLASRLDPHLDCSQLSCCCPVSWRPCHFGSAGPALLHTPPFHRWGRRWGGPTRSPGSGPATAWPWTQTRPSATP